MQASTQSATPAAAPQAPGTPAAPAAPQVTITTVGPGGGTQTLTVPRTRSEVEGLLSQREELSSQLINVSSRRRELSEEIRSAPEGASRTGLEERIRILDQRIVQLETDMATTGRQLSLAPASLTSSSQESGSGGGDEDEFFVVIGVMTMLALPVLAVVYMWRRHRRKRRGAQQPRAQFQADSVPRLERLEQGMDAIAVEIERISEGQRFVTKLLAESHTPIGVSNRAERPLPVERGNPGEGV